MRKKICFIVSSPGTAKGFLCKHIETLSSYYDIYLIANIIKEDNIFFNLPLVEIKNIPIQREINVIQDIKALLLLKKYFKKNRFDAIHSVTPKAGLLSMIAGRMEKIKIRTHIFTGQVWHTKTGISKKVLKLMDKCIVRNATNILVDGYSQREYLIKNNIIKETNSKVLGKGSISGVDTCKFIPDLQMSKDIREELKINPTATIFMFLGRLNKDKGILDLVDAFMNLKQKKENICLLIVGYDEEDIEKKVKNKYNNQIDFIIFYGPTDFPERMLQVCDVFCMPSYREGFGTSVLEASLLEKAIICSDTYGLKETIIENETGLRHKTMDIESLTLQMEKLVDNIELRFSLGEKGRKYILNNFSAQTITNEWIKFYKELFTEL